MTEVTVVSPDGHRLSASRIDVSSGGRSLKRSKDMPSGTNVEISLSRLSLPRVTIRAVVTWRKTYVQPADERRKNQAVDRHLPRDVAHSSNWETPRPFEASHARHYWRLSDSASLSHIRLKEHHA
jgi:hypothetical protein